jgi:hypothetical protein
MQKAYDDVVDQQDNPELFLTPRQEDFVYKMKGFPHDQLLKALYWVYDFMDRASINFFVVGKTAESVISKQDLIGDKITVGVRRLEWLSGAKQIADAFATPLKEDDKTVEYEYEGVPILLYILDDDPTIVSCNSEIYNSEFFRFPNPYSKFQEVFPWAN